MPHGSRTFVLAAALLLHAGALAGYAQGQRAFESQDYAEALAQWVAAARGGDTRALNGLGRLYERGLGVQRDPVRAHLFYNLAAFKGDTHGMQARDAIEGSMSPAQIKQAKDWALALVVAQRFVPEDMESLAAGAAPAAPAATAEAGPAPPGPPPVSTPGGVSLATRWSCEMTLAWADRGSGGEQDVALYHPVVPIGYSTIGGYAQGNYAPTDGCVRAVKLASGAAATLIRPPLQWRLLWSDRGSGAQRDGSIWVAEPPAPEFVCIGAVGQAGYGRPEVPNYVCVHRCLTREIEPTHPVWTDAGTGAAEPVAVYRLPESNSFTALPNRVRPERLLDIDPTSTCRSP